MDFMNLVNSVNREDLADLVHFRVEKNKTNNKKGTGSVTGNATGITTSNATENTAGNEADDSENRVSKCVDGLVQGGVCHEHVRFRIASGVDRGAYFSTWSFVLAVIGLLTALAVYAPCHLVNRGAYARSPNAWWLHYLVTPFVLTSAIASFAAFAMSQWLMSFHFLGALDNTSAINSVQAARVNRVQKVRNLKSRLHSLGDPRPDDPRPDDPRPDNPLLGDEEHENKKHEQGEFGKHDKSEYEIGEHEEFAQQGSMCSLDARLASDLRARNLDARRGAGRGARNIAKQPIQPNQPNQRFGPVALASMTGGRVLHKMLSPSSSSSSSSTSNRSNGTKGTNGSPRPFRLMALSDRTNAYEPDVGASQAIASEIRQRNRSGPETRGRLQATLSSTTSVPRSVPTSSPMMPFGISSPFGSPFGTASANTNNVQLTDIGSHHAETNATVDQVDATVDQVEEPTDIDLHALRALHHQYPHSDMYQVHSAEETFDSYVQRDIEQRDIEQHGAEPYGPKQGPEQRPKQGSEQGDIEQHGAEQGPRQDKEPGATRALIRASNLALVRDLVRASNRSPRLRNQNGDSLEDLERDFMSKAHRSKAKGKAGTEDSGQIADSGRASSASSASASAALNSTLHDTSIHVVHVDEQLRRNFVMHVVPACLAAVTVAVLCVGSLAHANVLYVMATTLGMLLVMFLGYLCIPVRNEKTGELLYGWRKIQYVYGDPPPLPFVAQTLFMLLAVAAIPLCMIGTSTDKASVWTSWDKWLTWNKRTHVGADVTNNLSADAGADVGAGAGADAGADAIPTAQIVPQNAVGIADFDSFDASL